MARFVLVHGAFSGAWIWDLLIEELEALGHSGEAFDLPGLGTDRTPVGGCTLDAYAARLCEVLSANSQPALVVGSSMGGIVATQGAARCPERVEALVYAAAFIPKDGQSLLDLATSPEGAGDQVQANLTVSGEPPVGVMAAAASRQALYECCADAVAASAIKRQLPQAIAPLATPVSIPPSSIDRINKYYVICLRDRAIQPVLQRRMIRDNPCADVVEINTDHTPQLSRPKELAKALDQFAAHAARSRR
jgi:pimeloyl-ACP methyl ester carboxylesterase